MPGFPIITTTGDLLIGGIAGIETRLPGNTTEDRQFLMSVGDGDDATAPEWTSIGITDVAGLSTALSGKASTTHSHVISDVTGLQTALSGKAPTTHTHSISDVTNLQTAIDAKASLSGATFAGAVQVGTGSTMTSYEHRTFGDAYVSGCLNIGNTTQTTPIAGGLFFSRSGSSEPFIHFSNSDGSTELGQMRGYSGGGIRFTNGNFTTEWVRITSDGRLGVGIPIGSSNSAVTDAITVRGNALLGPGNNSANADLRLHSARLWAVRSGTGGGFAIYDATADTNRLILSSTGDTIINSGRLLFDGSIGAGTSSPKAKFHGTGSTILGIATTAVADADIGNGQVNIWIDESGNKLMFKCKTSTGTIETGEIALT